MALLLHLHLRNGLLLLLLAEMLELTRGLLLLLLLLLLEQLLRGRTVAEDRGRGHVLELDVESFEQDLNLELEVELELCVLVELDHQTQDGHQPRVGGLEDVRLGALLHDLADEGNGHDESIAVVALDEKILERQVAVSDRLVSC